MRDLPYKLCTKSLSVNQHIISVTRGSPNGGFPSREPSSPLTEVRESRAGNRRKQKSTEKQEKVSAIILPKKKNFTEARVAGRC